MGKALDDLKAGFHSVLTASPQVGRNEKVVAMYLKKVEGPRAVRLEDGRILTRADLPDPKVQRWVASRKAIVVRAVIYGLLSQNEALEMYGLSEEEFLSWVEAVKSHGEQGLKVTWSGGKIPQGCLDG